MAAKEPDDNGIITRGQPTKYRKAYAQEIIDYFNVDVVKKVVDDPSGRGGTHTHYETVRVPSIIGFAAKVGVDVTTVYNWADERYSDKYPSKKLRGKLKHPEFFHALTRAQALEQSLIFEYGMAGRLDRGLAALYFTNKLGFKNKSEVDQNNTGEQKFIVETRTYNAPTTDKPKEDEGSNDRDED